MLLKKSLIGVALACTALSSHAFFSSTTDLGTLSPTPTGAVTFAGVGVLGINLLGNSFVFDLSAGSDVYLDVYTLAGVTLGGAFELSTAGGQEISSQLLASGTNLGLINADVLGYCQNSRDVVARVRVIRRQESVVVVEFAHSNTIGPSGPLRRDAQVGCFTEYVGSSAVV